MNQVVRDLMLAPDEGSPCLIGPGGIRCGARAEVAVLNGNGHILRRVAFVVSADRTVALASAGRLDQDCQVVKLDNEGVEDAVIQSAAGAFTNEIDGHYSAPASWASPRS